MPSTSARAVRSRAGLLWGLVSSGGTCLLSEAAPSALDLVRDPGNVPSSSFGDLLVQCCAVAAVGATLALWLVTTQVALAVLRTPTLPDRRVGRVRAALLAACGIAALRTTMPAQAAPPDGPEPRPVAELLAGLPLPDRAEGSGPRAGTTVLVRPGDSLWTLAARALGDGASRAEVASYWRRLLDLNAPATGADPDLVHPGQRLRLPPR